MSFSTSRSESLLPSIRVEDPILSIVVTRLSASSRSGEIVPKARHEPLNSSMVEVGASISAVIEMLGILNMSVNISVYVQLTSCIRYFERLWPLWSVVIEAVDMCASLSGRAHTLLWYLATLSAWVWVGVTISKRPR